uniref:Beta-lactamase-related domain-containing protein n=1 Tax=Meloidogyne enterolobii TaxID=390850 RepID=A0A6V7W111_MELEN|nr:unnamed protein product [Meloidogyne enterolobii]
MCLAVALQNLPKKNFSDGWEREGASVAIFWQGQLVVDLYGGFADKSSKAEWKENMRTVLFSASKAHFKNYFPLNYFLKFLLNKRRYDNCGYARADATIADIKFLKSLRFFKVFSTTSV